MAHEPIHPYYKGALDPSEHEYENHAPLRWDHFSSHSRPDLDESSCPTLVQVNPKGMYLLKLKEDEDKIVLWAGSADGRQTLAFGTPEDVARRVENNVKALAPGGTLVRAAVPLPHQRAPGKYYRVFDTARHREVD